MSCMLSVVTVDAIIVCISSNFIIGHMRHKVVCCILKKIYNIGENHISWPWQKSPDYTRVKAKNVGHAHKPDITCLCGISFYCTARQDSDILTEFGSRFLCR